MATDVPHAMSDADFVKALTIPSPKGLSTAPWTCVPSARATTKCEWGKKALVVKALTSPSKHTFRVDYMGRKFAIHLVKQERKSDLLQRVLQYFRKRRRIITLTAASTIHPSQRESTEPNKWRLMRRTTKMMKPMMGGKRTETRIWTVTSTPYMEA